MAGLTAQGLVIRTPEEVRARLAAKLLEAFPDLDLREGPEQQIIDALAEECGEQWEAIRAIEGAQGRGASGLALDQVAALTGTPRRPALRSSVTATVVLAAGATLPAGAVAAVAGDPDAQFRTTVPVTNSDVAPSSVSVIMESVQRGVVAAPATTLTAIVTPRAGWISIVNASAAAVGRLASDDAELRAQRERELSGSGLTSYGAIRASVSAVDDVQAVSVLANETLVVDGDGRPPRSFEVIAWCGAPEPSGVASRIAAAVLAKKPIGITSHGLTSGTTVDPDTGQTVAVAFTLASQLHCFAELEVILSGTQGAEWEAQVRAALTARFAAYTVGSRVYASQLIAAVLDDVPGVVAIVALTVGTSPHPVTVSVAATSREIPTLSGGDIAITVAP